MSRGSRARKTRIKAPQPPGTPPLIAEESTCGAGVLLPALRASAEKGSGFGSDGPWMAAAPRPPQVRPVRRKSGCAPPPSLSGQASAPSEDREGVRPDVALNEAAAAGGVASEPGASAPVSSQREALLPRGPRLAARRVAASSARRKGKAGGKPFRGSVRVSRAEDGGGGGRGN